LTISGLVTDLDCVPLEGAIVEIWQGYPTAVAVEDLKPSDSVDYDHDSAEMQYRGQMATDANGQYSFHTLKPGWYRNGNAFRPAHIHVKIWVDGVEQLTTQLYFEGDPFIETDPWASDALTVPIETDSGGAQTGRFDFVVDLT
jgi:protocatechuate 3,4-dioxygenase beta subunit